VSRPFGDDSWVSATPERLGREYQLRDRKRGRASRDGDRRTAVARARYLDPHEKHQVGRCTMV
jgi:hypothetical protein